MREGETDRERERAVSLCVTVPLSVWHGHSAEVLWAKLCAVGNFNSRRLLPVLWVTLTVGGSFLFCG